MLTATTRTAAIVLHHQDGLVSNRGLIGLPAGRVSTAGGASTRLWAGTA